MVRLIKEEFVPLAINGRTRYFKDAECEFLEKADAGSQGRLDIITASGKKLGTVGVLSGNHPKEHLKDLKQVLKAWSALPESERKPGAFKVPEPGRLDPRRNTAKGPPPGTLIVRVYNRQLERTKDGFYRHTVPADYIAPLRNPKITGTEGATETFTQPANDMMWITKAEAQAMMPAKPSVGQRVALPRTLCERIFRYHLDPSRGLSENNNFAGTKASAGKLELTVEAVSDTAVRLRIDGFVNLHNPRTGLLTYQTPA